MTYNPNIPQALDDPSVSQGQFLNNFFLLNQYFDVNHVPFTAGGNNGLHDKVTFPTSISDPNLAAPQSSVYPKTFVDPLTLASTIELFFQNGNQFFNVKQLTNSAVCNLVITNATQAVNCQITTATRHGLSNGNQIYISGVYGMTQLNGGPYTITVVNNTNFTINVDSTLFGAYSAPSGYNFNGYIRADNLTRYGFVSPWGLIFNFGSTNNSGTLYYSIPFTSNQPFIIPQLTTNNNNSAASPRVTDATNTDRLLYSSPGNIYYFVMGT